MSPPISSLLPSALALVVASGNSEPSELPWSSGLNNVADQNREQGQLCPLDLDSASVMMEEDQVSCVLATWPSH